MLKDTFFSITEVMDFENGRTYRLALHASHPIFQAHFAGNPIMPGACIVQMIKELTADYYCRKFFTCVVKNMKFLHPIDPFASPEISVRLAYTQNETNRVSVSAMIESGDTVFSKSTLFLDVANDEIASPSLTLPKGEGMTKPHHSISPKGRSWENRLLSNIGASLQLVPIFGVILLYLKIFYFHSQ